MPFKIGNRPVGWDAICQSCGISFTSYSTKQNVCSAKCRFEM